MTTPESADESVPGEDQGATATYWANGHDAQGNPNFIWQCYACNVAAFAHSEETAVAGMNSHMQRKHAGSGYVPVDFDG
jgi:hypothetical protein